MAERQALKNVEPFKTVLSGNQEAIAKLSMRDLEKILVATLTGMSVEEFNAEAKKWLETAKHPRWNRPYTDLAYQPMLELLRYLRHNEYKTYIVTGGVRTSCASTPSRSTVSRPSRWSGTAGGTKYGYGKDGKPFLTKEPKLLLNDNDAGKPEGIHLMIGRRPYAAFGNSTGDRQMCRASLALGRRRIRAWRRREAVASSAARQYRHRSTPAEVGSFTPALYEEAKKKGWTVTSMKNDWKRVFAFEK